MLDLITIIETYGYIGLFMTTFLESLLFFWLPGESMMFMGGFMASSDQYFKLIYLIPMFTVSSFLSNLGGYYIGRYLHIFHRYPIFQKLIKETHLNKAKGLFEKRGLLVIVVSKFITLFRTFVPICVGLTGMKASSFMFYNLIGSVLSAISFTLAGYYLGHMFPGFQEYISVVIILVILLSLLPLFKKVRHVGKYFRFNRKTSSSS